MPLTTVVSIASSPPSFDFPDDFAATTHDGDLNRKPTSSFSSGKNCNFTQPLHPFYIRYCPKGSVLEFPDFTEALVRVEMRRHTLKQNVFAVHKASTRRWPICEILVRPSTSETQAWQSADQRRHHVEDYLDGYKNPASPSRSCPHSISKR